MSKPGKSIAAIAIILALIFGSACGVDGDSGGDSAGDAGTAETGAQDAPSDDGGSDDGDDDSGDAGDGGGTDGFVDPREVADDDVHIPDDWPDELQVPSDFEVWKITNPAYAPDTNTVLKARGSGDADDLLDAYKEHMAAVGLGDGEQGNETGTSKETFRQRPYKISDDVEYLVDIREKEGKITLNLEIIGEALDIPED